MKAGENTRKTGEYYETEAIIFLEKQGYRILKRNYRCKIGEIDIIARETGVSGVCGGKIPAYQEKRGCCRGSHRGKTENDQQSGRLLYDGTSYVSGSEDTF